MFGLSIACWFTWVCGALCGGAAFCGVVGFAGLAGYSAFLWVGII